MNIIANGQTIPAMGVYEIKNTDSRQELKIKLTGEITAAQLTAIAGGSFEISDGNATHAHQGYTELIEHSVVLGKTIALVDVLAQERAALAEQALALEESIAAARAGLIAVPEAGEAWDSDKWYIAGDSVVAEGIAYTATCFSRGKAPAQTPDCWKDVS